MAHDPRDKQGLRNFFGMKNNSLVVNIGTGGQVAKLGRLQEVGLNQVRPYFDSKFIFS